jgi:hypothetical protein
MRLTIYFQATVLVRLLFGGRVGLSPEKGRPAVPGSAVKTIRIPEGHLCKVQAAMGWLRDPVIH